MLCVGLLPHHLPCITLLPGGYFKAVELETGLEKGHPPGKISRLGSGQILKMLLIFARILCRKKLFSRGLIFLGGVELAEESCQDLATAQNICRLLFLSLYVDIFFLGRMGWRVVVCKSNVAEIFPLECSGWQQRKHVLLLMCIFRN